MMTTGRLSAVIGRHWHALTGGERTPGRLSFLVLTKGRNTFGKIVFLTFVGGEALPRFVVKLGRLKRHNDVIEAEHRNLQLISALARHGRVRTPKPLLCWEDDGRLCLLESVLDGPDLGLANSRARSLVSLDPIVDWLINLARVTRGPTAHPGETFTELIDCAARHVRSEREEGVLQAIARRLNGHPADSLPQIFQHGDLGTWNVTVAPDGTIGILDWESARHDGFPAVDLFYFLAYYGSMMDTALATADHLQSFVETFFGYGTFARVATAAVHRYTDAVALPRGWLGPLFVTCWLQHAVIDVVRDGVSLSDSLPWQMLVLTLERDCRLNFLEGA